MYYEEKLRGLSKYQLALLGKEHILRFLDLNNIPHPKNIYISNQGGTLRGVCNYKHQYIQLWTPHLSYIASHPTPGKPGWSYPGYKTDATGIGVFAHETGHWVDRYLQIQYKYFNRWDSITFSSYHPNLSEVIAECMRLFILNPCLLYLIHPEYVDRFVKAGLKPLVTDDWDVVLANAPEIMLDVIHKQYIKNKRRHGI